MSKSIHTDTRLGAVHLVVTNLDQSLKFYQESLGFVLHSRSGTSAALGPGNTEGKPVGQIFLELNENPDAKPENRSTGLYHFAVLVPSRIELARVLQRIVTTKTSMQGFADHGVSEAIYLPDPDNNGIEIYRDRSRDDWPRNPDGNLAMVTDPFDFDGVMAELQGKDEAWLGVSKGTQLGHMHLYVRDIAEAERFYSGTLGFDLLQRYGQSASFVSAGGYHHHIGFNTWNGVGAPPPPADAIGLQWFDIQLPNSGELGKIADRVRKAGLKPEDHRDGLFVQDPSQNRIVISA